MHKHTETAEKSVVGGKIGWILAIVALAALVANRQLRRELKHLLENQIRIGL